MIIEQISEDFKNAMRAKNEIEVSALRIIKSEIKNAEIEKKSELTDDEILKVIAKKVKQHKDSIESFKSGGRQDLVEHEEKQMAILMKYLPQQMAEEQVGNWLRQLLLKPAPQTRTLEKS